MTCSSLNKDSCQTETRETGHGYADKAGNHEGMVKVPFPDLRGSGSVKVHGGNIRRIVGNEEVGIVPQYYVEGNIERLLAENNPHEEEKLRKWEEELQQELISLTESRKNYSHVVSKLQKVREEQTELENSRNCRSETISRITEFMEFIRGQSAELTEFDETLVRHWIKKITVHPDRLTIEFKTGDIVETGGDNE